MSILTKTLWQASETPSLKPFTWAKRLSNIGKPYATLEAANDETFFTIGRKQDSNALKKLNAALEQEPVLDKDHKAITYSILPDPVKAAINSELWLRKDLQGLLRLHRFLNNPKKSHWYKNTCTEKYDSLLTKLIAVRSSEAQAQAQLKAQKIISDLRKMVGMT